MLWSIKGFQYVFVYYAQCNILLHNGINFQRVPNQLTPVPVTICWDTIKCLNSQTQDIFSRLDLPLI